MAANLAQFEQQYGSKIRIIKVNVDDREQVRQYGQYKESRYIPETVVLKNDKAVYRKTGAMSLGGLVLALKAAP